MWKPSVVAFATLVSLAQCQDSKPLVTSQALQDLINIEDLLAGSQVLQDIADANGGNRAFGGAGHNATVDFLYETLTSLDYYDVYKQPFVELFTAATVNLAVNGESTVAEYMTYGPSGNVSAPIVAVSNLGCAASDYPSELTGKVALISRGECTFAVKAANAKTAGAAAALIYNNVPGAVAGTLGGVGDYAPTVGIAQDFGTQILDELTSSEVTATLNVNAIQENRTSYNVIAETKGGDKENVLMLGGHTDSVFAGPGVNDDGSGTIGILKVAEALTQFSVTNAVRFGFWSAEEFGLLGSKYYIKSLNGTVGGGDPAEIKKLRAYLNFDMIASPNYILGIYDGDGSAFNLSGPVGSATLEKNFETFFDSKSLPHVPAIFSGRSDYAAFMENGVPSGGLFTGAEVLKTEEEAALFGGEANAPLDANYHAIGDTIDNLNEDAYLWNSWAIADSVATYATSWDGVARGVEDLGLRRRWERVTHKGRSEHVHGHAPGVSCGVGTSIM